MLSTEEIKNIIPHREPFLLVDGVEVTEAGKSAKGFKKLTGNEDFFKGHFPDEPVMPGVLIIESMAQLGAVLALSFEQNKGKKIYFTSIDKVRFRKKVIPGDTLEMSVEFISFRHSMGRGTACAFVNGVEVCSAELGFAIV
ncbi:3-hydroxyacyl-ACP dehydratase FabZ [bacterium]|nr:3-hydroxyacyl-ACP dehydratase FabZ [bacterium]